MVEIQEIYKLISDAEEKIKTIRAVCTDFEQCKSDISKQYLGVVLKKLVADIKPQETTK